MCFITKLVNLQSPLEQFEVSSYGTSLSISVTNSVDLINEAFVPTYIQYSFINLFFVFIIYSIFKYIEFNFKQEGFLLLFFFITVLYTCFNLYSFTDFTVSEKSFQYFIKDHSIESSMNLIYIDEHEIGTYFTFLDWINSLPTFLFEYYSMNACFLSSPLVDRNFILDSYLPNLILHSKLLVGYAWFLGYLFNLDILNRLDENSFDFCLTLLTKFQNWSVNGKMNWSLLLDDCNFIYFKNVFLPKYEYIIDSIQYSLGNNNLLTNENHYFNYMPFEMPNWIIFILIFVGIFLASPVSNINLNMEAPISLDNLIQEPYALLNYIENNISNHIFIEIYSQIIYLFNIITCQVVKSMEYMIMLKQVALNNSMNTLINNNNLLNGKEVDELFIKNFFDNNIFITINTSFINIYSIFFCFIFIFFIIYILFNKSFSYNINTIIPNLYQILGENLYKISLNLFYSILGKHITHPEFYIKINTIFLFLVISNVQGMIPYMNTLTSALTNTFFIALALFISIINTLLDKKGVNYFLNLFMPSGCPIFLVLLLIPIELISYSFRVISISVRLFANMMAGHTLLKVIGGFSWVIVYLGNTSLINLFPILILFILTLLEFGVAFIQAYIFTILSCMYIRDIFTGH